MAVTAEEYAWHEERRGGLGGSDAPVVMGVSLHKTPYMLWAEKRGMVPPAPPNPAMARGTALEPVARAAYEREVGGRMFPCQMTPPEMTDRDVIERTDGRWAALAMAFLEAESVVAEWSAKKDAAREALIAEAGSVARVRGAGVLATRFVAKGTIDYGKIPVLKGLDLEQWRKPSREQW